MEQHASPIAAPPPRRPTRIALLPCPHSSVPACDAVAIKSEDLASELDEDDAKQRRRRRSRNAKQQELNRLAQQRYRCAAAPPAHALRPLLLLPWPLTARCCCRERKKAKYSEMQQSVDALASQLSQLQALRQENGALRGRAQQLETTIQQKDLQLRTHQEQLKQMQQILGRQVGTMREQQATIARQSAELAALQGRVDGSIDAALLSLDADTVSTKLSAAVKCALTGKELRGLHPTLGKIPDAVAQQISSTLTRCCAEMYQRLKQSGRAEPPPAIQVPCC